MSLLRAVSKFSLTALTATLLLTSFATPVFADLKGLDFSVGGKVGLPDDLNPQQKIGNLIVTIINILLGLSAVLALGAMIWGAILIITSAGKDDQVKKGREAIKWAIIGLILIGLSFIIVRFIGEQLGVGVAPGADPIK